MNIAEIRQKYPQYNDLSDEELAKGLHKKFYSDMDFGEFSNKIGLTPQINLTPEQKAQAQQKAKEYREQVKPTTFGDKVSEFLVTNPIARQVGFGLQGIANAGLNPAGYVARATGIDTKPLEAQTAGERATELAGQYGFDAAAIVPTLGLAASSSPAIAPYVAPLVEGGVPLALTGSTGSALATGIINPESTAGRIATDIIGGGLGAGLARPRVSMPKETKAISELEKTVGKDVLAENVAEAERTGRNLLEVGSDEITQRALQAKLQTPEARKILLDSIEQSSATQPARTKAVINEALGTEGKNSTLSQVMENAKAEAQPIYKELEDIGDLAAYETKDIPEQNFKRWFEGSQVVDENGQPLKLYHGTDADFDVFSFGKLGKNTGVGTAFNFTDSPETAKSYGNKVLKTYLNMQNPITVDFGDRSATHFLGKLRNPQEITDEVKNIISDMKNHYDIDENIIEELKNLGFREYSDNLDGIIFKNVLDNYGLGGKSANNYVVFNPNQIKSVNNSGAWSSSPSLSDAGWKPESQLANAIKNNDVLADTISRVKRANSSLKNLPDTDFRVVNEARKALSQASMNRTELSGYEARQALNELDPILNNITGGKLAQANKLYSDAYQFERASDLGRDVFNSRVSPDDMKVKIGALTANEKKAARIGLREEILNKIGSTNNQTNALNKLFPENVREKITTLAGEKEGAKIIDEAEQAVKLRNNLNKVFSGSQTAEKGALERAIAGVMNFKSHPVLSTVGSLYTPYNRGINIRAAETLTDKNIADAYRRVMNARNAPKQPKGYAQSGLRSIIERLTEENN